MKREVMESAQSHIANGAELNSNPGVLNQYARSQMNSQG